MLLHIPTPLRALGVTPDALVPREQRAYARLPGDRIAWVATETAGAERLAREDRVLMALRDRVPFAIPRVLDRGDGWSLRSMVPGASGPEVHRAINADPRVAARAGECVGAWLAALHGALGPDELAALKLPPPGWPLPPAALRAGLGAGHVPADLLEPALAAIARYAALPAEPVLVHGDFGTHNFAVDPGTLALRGLFDLDGASLADRHLDLQYVDSYAPAFQAPFIAAYQRGSGAAIDRARVRLTHAVSALSYLAWRAGWAPDDARAGRTLDQDLAWSRAAVDAVSAS